MDPENAFLAQTTFTYLLAANDQTRIDELIPVATALAFRIDTAWTALQTGIKHDLKDVEGANAVQTQTFILSQLIQMATHLDGSDEAGRRKMFTFVRKSLRIQMNVHISLTPLR